MDFIVVLNKLSVTISVESKYRVSECTVCNTIQNEDEYHFFEVALFPISLVSVKK